MTALLLTPQRDDRTTPWLRCVALATVFTLLNAVKPLHIDDPAYLCYAAQITRAPLSPYDFEILWKPLPCPANEVLAPPLLPYWWAAGLAHFGERPFLWKLWLLPFALVLAVALHTLLSRFAPGLEGPLLLLIVFSPALLPALNLMLDVPALALGLGALALFLRAADADSLPLALLAGAVAGLAAQTKYTAFVMPAVLLLWAVLARRVRLGVIAVATTLLVFGGWELFVALSQGESHFLCSLSQQEQGLLTRIGPLSRALFNLAGGLAPAVGILGLAALGLSGRWVLSAGAAVLLGYALIALGAPAAPIYRVHGVFVAGSLAAAGWRLRKHHQDGSILDPRSSLFLMGWGLLELAGYFALTPFPAARRVLGLFVAAVMLTGRLASRPGRSPVPGAVIWAVTGGAVTLGLLFYTTDLREAQSGQEVARRAAREVAERAPGGTVWHAATWGLRFHAESAEMKLLMPGRSRLRCGDWLIVPEPPLAHPGVCLASAPLVLEGEVAVGDALPLRTVWGYYGGSVPLEHHRGPRVGLRLYRVTANFTPQSGQTPVAQTGQNRVPHDSQRKSGPTP
ncbi:MAG: hypothetical protein L0Z62_00650 [Gemmataceae bacterium]|nr:hypothetical protein [Gemmataceae bacterium]